MRSTGRVAKRQEAASCGFKWPKNLSFRNTRKCDGPNTIGRCWRGFLSLRDPAALQDGRAAQPGCCWVNNWLALNKRMYPFRRRMLRRMARQFIG